MIRDIARRRRPAAEPLYSVLKPEMPALVVRVLSALGDSGISQAIVLFHGLCLSLHEEARFAFIDCLTVHRYTLVTKRQRCLIEGKFWLLYDGAISRS